MQTIEYINRLTECGIFQRLYRRGVINSKMMLYRDLKNSIDIMTSKGISKSDAIHETASLFNISDTTAWRADSMMSKKV